MNRVEIYKRKRYFKRKVMLVLMIFFLFIFAGVAVADYSANSLMKNEKRIEIISVDNSKDCIILDIMGKKLYLNLMRVKRDFGRVKELVDNMFG